MFITVKDKYNSPTAYQALHFMNLDNLDGILVDHKKETVNYCNNHSGWKLEVPYEVKVGKKKIRVSLSDLYARLLKGKKSKVKLGFDYFAPPFTDICCPVEDLLCVSLTIEPHSGVNTVDLLKDETHPASFYKLHIISKAPDKEGVHFLQVVEYNNMYDKNVIDHIKALKAVSC